MSGKYTKNNHTSFQKSIDVIRFVRNLKMIFYFFLLSPQFGFFRTSFTSISFHTGFVFVRSPTRRKPIGIINIFWSIKKSEKKAKKNNSSSGTRALSPTRLNVDRRYRNNTLRRAIDTDIMMMIILIIIIIIIIIIFIT